MKKEINDEMDDIIQDLVEISNLMEINFQEYNSLILKDKEISKNLCSILSKKTGCSEIIASIAVMTGMSLNKNKVFPSMKDKIKQYIIDAEALIEKNKNREINPKSTTNSDTLENILKDFDLIKIDENKKIIN